MQVILRGCTRFVILTEKYAFKVARPCLGYSVGRVFAILFRDKNREEKFSEWRRDRGGVLKVITQALGAGILSNIREYRLSRSGCEESKLAETVFSIGILNVQRRGEPVHDHSSIEEHPIFDTMRTRVLNPSLIADMTRPDQYCLIDGEVRLADYGNPMLWDVLKAG